MIPACQMSETLTLEHYASVLIFKITILIEIYKMSTNYMYLQM